jgi:hypothetical protein
MVRGILRLGCASSLILLTQIFSAIHNGARTDGRHAFYLSVIEIAYQPESGKTLMHLKVFSDDLQNAVSEFYKMEHLLALDVLCESSLDHLTSYLKEHIGIRLNDVPVTFQMPDCRVEGDSHWLTFEISEKSWKHIAVTADYFMELFPTQTHVVSVQRGDSKRFARLTQGRKSCEFDM